MFLSDLSIKRPVVATVMMLTLVTIGLFSWRRLPVDMMPEVEIPVLSIITEFPGASPETVEREVSRKIEEAVNPISGVKHVNSISRESLSTVIVEFELEVKINDVSQEARAKINAIRRDLPDAMKEPVIQKFDFAAMPVISLAVRSTTMSSVTSPRTTPRAGASGPSNSAQPARRAPSPVASGEASTASTRFHERPVRGFTNDRGTANIAMSTFFGSPSRTLSKETTQWSHPLPPSVMFTPFTVGTTFMQYSQIRTSGGIPISNMCSLPAGSNP